MAGPHEHRERPVHVRLHHRSTSRPRRPTREAEADPGTWISGTTDDARSCCPATRSRARSTPRSRPGVVPSTAACTSTSPHARRPTTSASDCPSMYHQFKELADVDITKEPMEVGPTCHYIMGGVRVDADTAATAVPGLFAAGEVAGGMHGSNRLGGNSLSDLLVFGRRAGLYAASTRTRSRHADRRRAGGRGGGALDARAVRSRGRREPVRDPRGPSGVHARA